MFKSRFFAIGLVIFSLVWLNANHYRPWLTFHSEALACIALSFLSASLLICEREISIPRITGWIVFTALLPWLQYISGISLLQAMPC